MKQSEIDRWMRRQARRDSQRTVVSVNWALIVALLMIGVACLYVLLKLTHVG